MTAAIEFPPGDPGTPPHHHSGPAFSYVLEGEMLLEAEDEPESVVRAGEAFWEPGGDVIHYQDGNNRGDIPLRFTVTMLCEPGKPISPWSMRKSSPSARTAVPLACPDHADRTPADNGPADNGRARPTSIEITQEER